MIWKKPTQPCKEIFLQLKMFKSKKKKKKFKSYENIF